MIDYKKVLIVGVLLFSPFVLAACKTSQGTGVDTETVESTNGQQNAELGATIEYTDNGFSPDEVKIKVGQKVDIKNSTSKVVQFNSDPHPTHTSFPILNINIIDVGGTKSVVFDKAGTFKYHNHLNASERGTIIVE